MSVGVKLMSWVSNPWLAPQAASHHTQPALIPGSRQIWVLGEGRTGALKGAEASWSGWGKDLSIGTWWVTVETGNLETWSSEWMTLFCHRELFCHFRMKILKILIQKSLSLFFPHENDSTLILLSIKSTNWGLGKHATINLQGGKKPLAQVSNHY